jgi:hypothetical protein
MIRGLLSMLMALTACGAQRTQAGIAEASEFRLLDGLRVRARLAVEGGAPVFALLDGAGRPALRSELDGKGTPRIMLLSNEPLYLGWRISADGGSMEFCCQWWQ